ncbi:hypothetical protein TNCV_2252271 [Trichonephila clavipes]|nr:hypothetical protein TNCV_2252271 [Trichonephila clavipes]
MIHLASSTVRRPACSFHPDDQPPSNSLNREKCLLAHLPGMLRVPKSSYNRRVETKNILKGFPKNSFQNCYQQWQYQMQKRVNAEGNYFEECHVIIGYDNWICDELASTIHKKISLLHELKRSDCDEGLKFALSFLDRMEVDDDFPRQIPFGGIEVYVSITFQDGDRFNSCQVIYSQFGLAIHQNDHQARRRFVEWAQNEIAVVPDFHKRILFSDEAHFWLNGYVNKQNCSIWSEANP